MLGIIFTLLMLVLLQAVLGFDNLLYISLESKKAPEKDQKRVRKTGILIAIGLRIVLLFVLVSIIDFFQEPFSWLSGGIDNVVKFAFNGHSLIVLAGGGFIIYTAIKEIWHMIATPNLDKSEMVDTKGKKTANAAIVSIVIMNLVFSFDSILAAIGLTSEIENSTTAFIIMAIAIVVSGLLMLFLADKVSAFLAKNIEQLTDGTGHDKQMTSGQYRTCVQTIEDVTRKAHSLLQCVCDALTEVVIDGIGKLFGAPIRVVQHDHNAWGYKLQGRYVSEGVDLCVDTADIRKHVI